MIRSQTVGKGALHLTIAKITTTVIALVSSMLLSRFRTLEEYGTYSQLLTVITLATSLFMMGLPNSCNFYLARADSSEERRNFLSVYYTLNTILCAVIGIVLASATPLIESFFGNPNIHLFSYFLLLYPFAYITISGISNVLVVYGRTQKLMLINVLTSLVALTSVIIIQLLGATFSDYLKLYLAGNIIIAIWNYSIVFKLESHIRPAVDFGLIKKLFAYSIPIGLATLVGTVDIELDKLMIGKMMDPESFALYSNAGKELPLTMISASLTAVLLPKMAGKLKRNEAESAVDLWGETIELSYIAMCFFTTALFVFAPQIMTILYSEKYLPGANVFRVYSLVLLLRTTYFGIVLNSSGKTKFVFWSSLITLGVNIVLNLVLYYLIGFVGPAIATFVSIAVCDICQLLMTCKLLNFSMKNIFPWGHILQVTAANVIWGMIAYLIVRTAGWGTDGWSIVYCVLTGFVIAMIYLFLFRKKLVSLWHALNQN